MPPIDRSAAKECVRESLKLIADFKGDCESFTFEHWHQFHKSVFINAVGTCIRKKGSTIVLNEGILQDFATVGAFIDFVKSASAFDAEPRQDLHEYEGDLS